MNIRFEWDPEKSKRNIKKHRISFETAIRAFADPFALMEQDRIDGGEYRWQTLGFVEGHLLVLVAHTIWDDEDGAEVIRIISARRAEQHERNRYEQNRAI
jgi:uncharacterized DUF497 family protein